MDIAACTLIFVIIPVPAQQGEEHVDISVYHIGGIAVPVEVLGFNVLYDGIGVGGDLGIAVDIVVPLQQRMDIPPF